jgi:hypothetical protein
MAQEPNVRDAMLTIGWTTASWTAAGHQLDPYGDYGRGVWTINPYVSLRPPVVVAASAPRPAGPCEAAHAPHRRLALHAPPAMLAALRALPDALAEYERAAGHAVTLTPGESGITDAE